MIAWLNGVLRDKQPPVIILDVNGVGYELEAPLSTFYELPAENSPLSLFVHLVVREDAQLLFGFATVQQRDLFRSLIRVNGVGPKVALAVLSTFSAQDLMRCMLNEDVSGLTKVPGIGKKTAQRLLVEMKDRLEKEFPDIVDAQFGESTEGGTGQGQRQDAISALVSLGYKSGDATRVVQSLEPSLTSEEIIRQALRILSGKVL